MEGTRLSRRIGSFLEGVSDEEKGEVEEVGGG
jgi:hypothetical protein